MGRWSVEKATLTPSSLEETLNRVAAQGGVPMHFVPTPGGVFVAAFHPQRDEADTEERVVGDTPEIAPPPPPAEAPEPEAPKAHVSFGAEMDAIKKRRAAWEGEFKDACLKAFADDKRPGRINTNLYHEWCRHEYPGYRKEVGPVQFGDASLREGVLVLGLGLNQPALQKARYRYREVRARAEEIGLRCEEIKANQTVSLLNTWAKSLADAIEEERKREERAVAEPYVGDEELRRMFQAEPVP